MKNEAIKFSSALSNETNFKIKQYKMSFAQSVAANQFEDLEQKQKLKSIF